MEKNEMEVQTGLKLSRFEPPAEVRLAKWNHWRCADSAQSTVVIELVSDCGAYQQPLRSSERKQILRYNKL